jgi:hypothetical protein
MEHPLEVRKELRARYEPGRYGRGLNVRRIDHAHFIAQTGQRV